LNIAACLIIAVFLLTGVIGGVVRRTGAGWGWGWGGRGRALLPTSRDAGMEG